MRFEKWLPIEGIAEMLYLEAVHDDHEGFRLLLQGDKNHRVLRISFDSALSYRNTDEGGLIKTINQNDVSGWSLYTVSDSDFLAWFTEESHGIHESDDVVHYAIYTPNDCLDVLSVCPPKVEWLN